MARGTIQYAASGKFASTGVDDNGDATTLTIDANENLGIGGVSPIGTHSTLTSVRVGGNAVLTHATAAAAGASLEIGQNTHYDTDGSWEYISTDEASRYTQFAGEHIFFGAASGTAGNDISWTEALRIKVDGKVGIGTTAPIALLHVESASSGIATLHADADDLLVENSGAAGISINGSGTDGCNIFFGDSSNASDGRITFLNTVSAMTFHTNSGAERMRIDNAGNVGIGTTAPSAPLNIRSDSATVGGIPLITLENLQADGTASTGAHINFYLDNTNSENTGGSVGVVEDGNDGYAELVFKTTPASNSSTLNERMRITSDGYVGIGTSSIDSSAFVHMSSPYQNKSLVIEEDNDGNSNSGVIIQKNHSTLHPANYYYGHILFKGWDGDQYRQAASIVCVAEGTPANDQMPGNLRFNVNNDTTGPTEAMRIVKTGKVGIGTTSTSNQLYVYTDDYMDSGALYPYNGATLHLKSTATNTDRGPGIAFSDGTEDKGFITMNDVGSRGGELNFYCRGTGGGVTKGMQITNGGNVNVKNGSVGGLSDIRIKKDVADLTDGLNIVNKLKPRTFKFNGKHTMAVDDGETYYGFVADEVLSVASQYVELTTDNIDGEKLDDVKTISTGKMIPMLVNAVKELSAEVTALKNAR